MFKNIFLSVLSVFLLLTNAAVNSSYAIVKSDDDDVIINKSGAAGAQTPNRYYAKGYEGAVEIGLGQAPLELMTVHGYRFGNGLYTGLGAGMLWSMPQNFDPNDIVPVAFGDIKYSFLNSKFSPFVLARFGAQADFLNDTKLENLRHLHGESDGYHSGVGYFARLGVGVDYKWLSLGAGCGSGIRWYGDGVTYRRLAYPYVTLSFRF